MDEYKVGGIASLFSKLPDATDASAAATKSNKKEAKKGKRKFAGKEDEIVGEEVASASAAASGVEKAHKKGKKKSAKKPKLDADVVEAMSDGGDGVEEEDGGDENVPELPQGTDVITKKAKKVAPPTRRENLAGKKKASARKQEIKSSEQRTLFVGNVPAEAKTRALKRLFDAYGAIEGIYARSLIQKNAKLTEKMIHTDKTKKIAAALTTKNVFVRFTSAESAQAAAKAMNGHLFENHNLRVSLSTKHELAAQARTVFVGNLAFEATDQAVHDYFSRAAGAVETVRLIRDRLTGRCTGVGYVAFCDFESVLAALKLDGAEFERRKLRVSKLLKKKQRPEGTKRFSHASYKDSVKNPGFKKRGSAKPRTKKAKVTAENMAEKIAKFSTFKKDEILAATDAGARKKKFARKSGAASGDAPTKSLSKGVRKVIKKRHNAKKSKSIMN